MRNDEMGDRMKLYERRYAECRLLPDAPVVARMDGRCFSSFTRGLQRPYDERLSRLMVKTTKFLVESSNASMGYTQSDEITLTWRRIDDFFGGKVHKVTSGLASLCTAKFNALLPKHIPEKSGELAFFDCRAWDLPNATEAANALLWREFDATKNSIASAARSHFSHKSLAGMNGAQMQERLWREAGVNWNDYPTFFKRGTYVRRSKVKITLTTKEMERIPKEYRPDGPRERTIVEIIDMPQFSKVTNRVEVIFDGAAPITES